MGPWEVSIVTGHVTASLGNRRLSFPTDDSFITGVDVVPSARKRNSGPLE